MKWRKEETQAAEVEEKVRKKKKRRKEWKREAS